MGKKGKGERKKVERHEEGKSQVMMIDLGSCECPSGRHHHAERTSTESEEGAERDRLTYRRITHRLVFAVGGFFVGPSWCAVQNGGG